MSDPRVIVSLTSFPAAIHLVPEVIKSILEGTVLPDKIVLYLASPQFPANEIPAEIEALKENPIFEVRWCERDIRSYKKLLPALHDFPDDIIITIDDDLWFKKRLVEMLLKRHKKYPNAIVGHRVRRIVFDREGNVATYLKWKRYKPKRYLIRTLKPLYRNLTTGGAGTLYPPRCLDPKMLDPDLFMAMAPTTDDIWFWAAGVSAGTKTTLVPFGYWRLCKLDKPDEIALSTTNLLSGVDVNLNVMNAILRKFPVIRQRLLQLEN